MLLQDVAVKVFSKQEYSEEIITSFRQEVLCCTCFIMILKYLCFTCIILKVSLMKRLRHPNVLLFMGAVTSPQRLCIVTEFLPRFGLISLAKYYTSFYAFSF